MLDLLSHDTSLWVAISFVIFCYGSYKLGGKIVVGALDKKIEEIRKEIHEAENLRVEAQELLAQYQRKQRDAEKEAKEILEKAKSSAKQIQKKAESDLENTMARKETQLAERLKRMEENAIAEIQSHAADLAVAATTEIIAQKLDKDVDGTLVQDTIKKLPESLN